MYQILSSWLWFGNVDVDTSLARYCALFYVLVTLVLLNIFLAAVISCFQEATRNYIKVGSKKTSGSLVASRSWENSRSTCLPVIDYESELVVGKEVEESEDKKLKKKAKLLLARQMAVRFLMHISAVFADKGK